MKKTLVFTLVLTLILSIATFVNAATEVKVADTATENGKLTVTVDLGAEVRGGVIRVKYNPDVILLNSIPTELAGLNVRELGSAGNDGLLFVGDADTKVSTITLEFSVVGKVGATTDITVTGEDFTNGANEAVEITFPAAKSVTVVAGTPQDQGTTEPGETTTEPGSDNQGTQTGTPADKGTTTDKTKYPQTGINVGYVAGAVVLAVVAGYVVTKRS